MRRYTITIMGLLIVMTAAKQTLAQGGMDSIGQSYTATLTYGDDYKIFLGIQDDPPGNIYTWYKDGQPYTVITGIDYLQFTMLQASDEGSYSCIVTNPDSASFHLDSRPVMIKLVGTCRERDSLALVALLNASDGPNWELKWNINDPISEWPHVILDEDDCVIQLRLGQNNLNGNIPIEISMLLALQNLLLQYNNLYGEIPTEACNLLQLEELILNGNKISGILPEEIGLLSKLIRIQSYSNLLSGNIPSSIGELKFLEEFFVERNEFSGNIPSSIGNCTNLKYLQLEFNNLNGEIPKEIGNLIELIRLDLNNNELSGEIPKEIGNLTNLTWLRLSQNHLQGKIPGELSKLINLSRFLFLQNNFLNGCIPVSLIIHCDVEASSFSNNPGLPWGGDFERFCSGENQIGASCDDGDPTSYPDIITQDCGCEGLTSLGYFLIGSTSFCSGSNARIEIIAGGGIKPYEFLWDGDTTTGLTLSIEVDNPGSYPLAIKDANGNEFIDTITFEVLPDIVLERVIEKKANGSLELILSGGNGDLIVKWSNGATGKILSNVLPGYYTCIVTDAAGCSMTFGPFEIGKDFDDDNGGPDKLEIDPPFQPIVSEIERETKNTDNLSNPQNPLLPINKSFSELHVYPNPTSGFIQINLVLEVEMTVDIELYDLMGSHLMKKEWYGKTIDATIDLSDYPDGMYILSFRNNVGQDVMRLVKS